MKLLRDARRRAGTDDAAVAALLEESYAILSTSWRESIPPPASARVVTAAPSVPPARATSSKPPPPDEDERLALRLYPIPTRVHGDDAPTSPGVLISELLAAKAATASSLRLTGPTAEDHQRTSRPPRADDQDSLPAVLQFLGPPRVAEEQAAPSTDPPLASGFQRLDYEIDERTEAGVPREVMRGYMLEVAKKSGR